MNPMGLMEMAQINEQEHMREALRRAALREARKQAGLTWIQVLRARLFGSRGVVTTPAAAAAQAPTPAATNSVAPTTSAKPVLVHEVVIRQHAARPSGSVARATAPAPKLRVVEADAPLRVVEADELDCVGADC